MKKTLVWVVVAVVVGLGIWMMTKNNGSMVGTNNSSSPTPATYGTTVSVALTPKSMPTSGTSSGGGTAGGQAVSYGDITNQYRSSMVQFNDRCQATPERVVVKYGSKILLDNRSADTKTVKIESDTYILAGYSWRVVTPTTGKTLPQNIGIDCKSSNGTTENTATLNLQANISNGL